MIMEALVVFPYSDNKAIPWRYECNIVSLGTLNRQELLIDIMVVGHFTNNGRYYESDEKKSKKRKK